MSDFESGLATKVRLLPGEQVRRSEGVSASEVYAENPAGCALRGAHECVESFQGQWVDPATGDLAEWMQGQWVNAATGDPLGPVVGADRTGCVWVCLPPDDSFSDLAQS